MAKKKSATKKLVIVASIAILLLAALALLAKSMGWIGSGATEKSVQTATASYRTVTQQVSASGKIQPENNVVIRSDVSGEIIALNVREGDYVRNGDLLLRIRPDTYKAQIDQQNASLLTQKAREKEAKSNMLEAKSSFKRQKKLYDKNLSSESEFTQSKNNFETKKAAYEAARYQVQSVQAQLQQAKEELQKTIIRAPKDGTVSKLAVEQGERVLGNTQMTGTEIMRIADMNNMEVQVNVNENDIVNVAIGDTANIEVDAYPDRIFKGIVTEIANSADVSGEGTTEQVTNYEVKVRVTTPHNVDMKGANLQEQEAHEISKNEFYPDFKPGMSATVDIRTKTVPHAVAVPIQAVTVRNISNAAPADSSASVTDSSRAAASNKKDESGTEENLQKVVFLVKDGKAHRQLVKTGISDKTHICILSGVKNGEEIVTGNYRMLSKQLADGDAVKVNDNPFSNYTANE